MEGAFGESGRDMNCSATEAEAGGVVLTRSLTGAFACDRYLKVRCRTDTLCVHKCLHKPLVILLQLYLSLYSI